MDAPLLETFKVKVDGTLSKPGEQTSLLVLGQLDKVTFKGALLPKPFNDSVILSSWVL